MEGRCYFCGVVAGGQHAEFCPVLGPAMTPLVDALQAQVRDAVLGDPADPPAVVEGQP